MSSVRQRGDQASQSGADLGGSIERNSVALQVLERIKSALIRGELQPGDYLPSETVLAQRFQIGKSSVREAIKMLQAIGVVEVRRGQGTVIREQPGSPLVDPLDFGVILARGLTKEVLDFRGMFEPAYTLMAMERATEADHRAIRQAIDDLAAAISNGEQTARHDIAFHRAILHATRNPMTIRVGETLLQLIEAALETSMQNFPETALRDHRAIYAAFRDRDANGVIAAIRQSEQSWETELTHPEEG